MNLKGFLKNRKRRKQRERKLENTLRKSAFLNLRLLDLQLSHTLEHEEFKTYLHKRLTPKDDYSR